MSREFTKPFSAVMDEEATALLSSLRRELGMTNSQILKKAFIVLDASIQRGKFSMYDHPTVAALREKYGAKIIREDRRIV